MNSIYQRPLGGTERMRLWFPNINVVMAARLKGNITERDLNHALAKARQKHPLLGARVQFDSEGQGLFTTRDVPPNALKVIPRETQDDWLTWVKQELRHPWQIGTGPLARFILLHAAGGSDLLVNAHHSICDARSLAYLIRDILRILEYPDQEIHTVIPLSLADSVPSSATGGFLYRWVIGRMNKKWLAKNLRFGEADYQKLHRKFWKDRQAQVLSWSLSREQTAVLIERCQMEHVRVNSAIYAAFLAAQHQCQQTSLDYYKNVMVPVDFRKYLNRDISQALGMYASAVKLQFKYDATKPFWETVGVLDRKIQRKLTEKNIFASQRSRLFHPSLMDGIAQAMFGDFRDEMAQGLAERMQQEVRTGVLVSNLGRLDFPAQYKHLELEWIKPPAVYAGNAEKAVEVLTIAGRMHFTLTFGEMDISPSRVKQVKAAAMKILTDGADWR
jgi:NRPS condensation-like uncharacterized protein